MKVVHEGRGGYIELEGVRYNIEHIEVSCFAIHFPCGNRHKFLQSHLDQLTAFAESREPRWYVENR
jgi:hypothetical protein